MWVMGEWSVGQWIVGVMSFQKMYGLYGLKHHIVEKSGVVTDAGRTGRDRTSEERATQLLLCEKLSLATMFSSRNCLKYSQVQVQNFTIFKAFLVTCMLL